LFCYAQPIIPPDLRKKPRKPVNSDVSHAQEKSLESFEFASVTYCTQVPRGTYPSEKEAAFVALQVSEVFQTKLNLSPYSNEISVERIEYGVGCILTTITLTATVGALYKFVKDYPKFSSA
jgi:hypothetical protein